MVCLPLYTRRTDTQTIILSPDSGSFSPTSTLLSKRVCLLPRDLNLYYVCFLPFGRLLSPRSSERSSVPFKTPLSLHTFVCIYIIMFPPSTPPYSYIISPYSLYLYRSMTGKVQERPYSHTTLLDPPLMSVIPMDSVSCSFTP